MLTAVASGRVQARQKVQVALICAAAAVIVSVGAGANASAYQGAAALAAAVTRVSEQSNQTAEILLMSLLNVL